MIEAAENLPRWADPETCVNRVSRIFLIKKLIELIRYLIGLNWFYSLRRLPLFSVWLWSLWKYLNDIGVAIINSGLSARRSSSCDQRWRSSVQFDSASNGHSVADGCRSHRSFHASPHSSSRFHPATHPAAHWQVRPPPPPPPAPPPRLKQFEYVDIDIVVRRCTSEIDSSLHRCSVHVPAGVAALLNSYPALIAPAVHALCQRDASAQLPVSIESMNKLAMTE